MGPPMSNEFWEIAAAPICLIVAGLVVYVCIAASGNAVQGGRLSRCKDDGVKNED